LAPIKTYATYTVSELKLSDGGAKISTVGSSDALLFNDDEKLLSGPYSITPLRASLLVTRHNRNGVFCVMVDFTFLLGFNKFVDVTFFRLRKV